MKPLNRILVSIWVAVFLVPSIIMTPAKTAGPTEPELPEFSHSIYLPVVVSPTEINWPMVAANLQRTSWTPEEVSGMLNVQWYRPIEAYISQNVQLIASDGLIFVATARGLYALDAENGELAWRFDTEMPLGNSPTVASGVVYVGGYDRKLHALDVSTGAHLWEFADAGSGFDTNPLVVDGMVYAGNRDGYMYAIGAHQTAKQGELVWKYKTGGAIHLSAAYKDGVLYFAANDNYAYALKADNGGLVWKSNKLLGDGYQSYWPVVYQDVVIFSGAQSYRPDLEPGSRSVLEEDGSQYDLIKWAEFDDIFYNLPFGTPIGPQVSDQSWANGNPVIDASLITQYQEDNPHPDIHKHKPWRRTFFVLNITDGSEFTFDSDSDGYGEYIPAAWWGTNSGNRYPPIVGGDDTLYFNNLYTEANRQGKVMGWKLGTQYLSMLAGNGAIEEPQSLSAGGNLIYRSICCDRVGDLFSVYPPLRNQSAWSYNLEDLAPGYDDMWALLDGLPNLNGWYRGKSESINGIYHNHGVQNPIIPYKDRLFIHRSNAVIAFGPGTGPGKLPLVAIQSAEPNQSIITQEALKTRLETEVRKIVDTGHLRPGYYTMGQFSVYKEFADYFDNPGDTLYTLAIAYPHLSESVQEQVRVYLRNVFMDYFDPAMYATIGWADGAPREAMPLPPEIENNLSSLEPRIRPMRASWGYPQHNYYGMWKYAGIFPQDAARVYELAKSTIQVPVPDVATTEYFIERPYEMNGYIAGYIGFLNLQTLAGKADEDAQLRVSVSNELDRLLQLRALNLSKNTSWLPDKYTKKHLDVARNFILLVPELGDYLYQHAFDSFNQTIQEYNYVAPYWFVSRYESAIGEGTTSALYNYSAIFQAKAFIQKESKAELSKYLDVPAFERGDLLYIQNLVAVIEAP